MNIFFDDVVRKDPRRIDVIDTFEESVLEEKRRLACQLARIQQAPLGAHDKERNILRFELMSLQGLRTLRNKRRQVRNWIWKQIYSLQIFTDRSDKFVDRFTKDLGLAPYGQEIIVKLLIRLQRHVCRATY